ncbi:DUF3027 domain-containing protein [Nocardia sp. NPDC051052]|uniref:DUF3027 domain-containing protein n=1 Tax=Nocardia sp. NPDC051052 TaxID=3364322 RepID=UPI00379B72FE
MSAVSVSESGVRPILADAVDLARRALLELEPAGVGAHLGVATEDDSAATHRFEATLPGYRGWQWAVVVAAPPEADYATVSESALLPGPDALVAPDFVPWDQRIRPGDLAPGDLLAPRLNDPRLVPGYVANGDPAVDEVALEIGLGRTQVLSLEGREEAAERWHAEFGPEADMAKAAPSTCGLCGFYLPLAGSLRAAFGVCGNAMGADGHVVHAAYGCGAHSDTVAPTGGGSPLYEAFDDAAVEMIPAEAPVAPVEVASAEVAAATAADASAAETVSNAETAVAEAESADAAVVAAASAAPTVEASDVVLPDAAPSAAVQVGDEGGAAIAGTGTASDGAAVTGPEPSVEVVAEPSVEEAVLADSDDSVVAPSADAHAGDESASAPVGTEMPSADAGQVDTDEATADVADSGAEAGVTADGTAEAGADAVQASSGAEQVVDGEAGAVESSPQS